MYWSQINVQADHHEDDAEPVSATQYCFIVVWRVLQSLPPSVEFLEGLVPPPPPESGTM